MPMGCVSRRRMFVRTVAGSIAPGVASAMPSRQPPGVGVVLVQAAGPVAQRDQSRGGHDPGLAPRAADQDPRALRLADEVVRPAHHRADRRAQALGQAEHHRVDVARVVGDRRAGGRARVEQPRAVQVDARRRAPRDLGHCPELVHAPRVPPAAWWCSPAQRGRRSRRRTESGSSAVAHLVGVRRPSVLGRSGTRCPRGWPRSRPRSSRRATSRSATTKCPARVCSVHGDLVPHGAGGHVQGVLLADDLGRGSCSRFTVGSSPYQSSPTSAAAIAARMASDGLVTVSERRSIGRPHRAPSIVAGP